MQARKKVTVPTLVAMKAKQRRIVTVTAYDATFARLADAAGVDILLVGDSLGMVVQGHNSTIPVTIDDMVYHTRAVARGTQAAHLCADLPFLSASISPEKALMAAGRLVQEGHAESVKIEGGEDVAPAIERIVRAGIPVMGHIGLMPQSVHAMGGFRTQGKTEAAQQRIMADAKAVVAAGAFALVLEGIPADLAAQISAEVSVPTIGIAAGPHCDGQVLVIYDLLGMNPDFNPSFLKKYADLAGVITGAVRTYGDEVRAGDYPPPPVASPK
ncbi:MAG: 3-methyl-2-oxobutanoate hydroxymethyltransferase [Myxococcales bacterium]|jgi:3-methyl-2-oxobutanoate hydroxymethyltransferase|nr:3-methyl-2-oxobutanoate hydroxymethyltransferase [Myxococcales bacterium]